MKRKRRNKKSARETGESKACLPASASSSSISISSILIPGLPSDVALLILARLPPLVQSRLRLVCRSWYFAMEPAAMRLLRKTLLISETWLVVSNSFYKYALFTVTHVLHRRTRRIFCPPQLRCHRSSHRFSFFGIIGHEVLIAVKPTRQATALELQGVYSFDGARMKWNDTKYSSLPRNVAPVRATDMERGYLYVGKLSDMQRLDLKTRMWEALPDPHVKRREFAGVMLQSNFCMVGGKDANDSVCNSGEIWDMASGEWTLVPELWPFEVFGNRTSKSRVAVVLDQLYALRTSTRSEAELMYYETSSKLWISLGYVPDCNDDFFYVLELFGMDQELWVIDQTYKTIRASKPSLSQSLSWRIIPYSLTTKFGARYMGAMLV